MNKYQLPFSSFKAIDYFNIKIKEDFIALDKVYINYYQLPFSNVIEA